MQTTPPDMAPNCVPSTSGTNSQNVLPISAEPSLSTLNITLSSDTFPEDAIPFRLLNISPGPKIPRKNLISESNSLFPLKKLIMPRK
jgi:hypothetical protein